MSDDTEVMAMNEPHIAPWWFPADDHPRDKARFDISIAVPSGQQVIANGRLVSRTRSGTRTTWHWRARDPMASYLAFFAAGRFVIEHGTTNGLPWTNAVSSQLARANRTRMLALLQQSRSIVGWLASQLGTYPFETTGGVVTNLFTGFALENQTRPTYPLMFGPQAHSVVVHELAHQWFGDDVTVRRWRDIWLNEGFATFMEHRYDEAHGGQSVHQWLADTYASYPADDQIWAMKIGAPGAGSIFDIAVYERGAMTLQALRNRIGDTEFWRLLRTWVVRHHGGHGAIWQFMGLAEQVSGEQLDGFFQAWLFTASKPAATAVNGLG
jgi:aminopeptidase N